MTVNLGRRSLLIGQVSVNLDQLINGSWRLRRLVVKEPHVKLVQAFDRFCPRTWRRLRNLLRIEQRCVRPRNGGTGSNLSPLRNGNELHELLTIVNCGDAVYRKQYRNRINRSAMWMTPAAKPLIAREARTGSTERMKRPARDSSFGLFRPRVTRATSYPAILTPASTAPGMAG